MILAVVMAAGLITAEADFSDPSAGSLVHDYPVQLDLSEADGVEFDFECPDFAPFHQFNCYFKSGDGWYALTMNPEEQTGVQRMVVRKRDVKWQEGKVAGWHDISAVRIYGYAGNPMKAKFAAGNFEPFVALKSGERRLLWCHSPWGLGYNEADWAESARLIKAAGFTDVIASLAWANGACYKSEVLPPSPQFEYRKLDAFDAAMAACHAEGMKLHVWMVCFNMSCHCGDKVKDELTAAGRTQVDAKGKPNKTWLCPSHPENTRQIVEALVEIAKKGADGVHLDYIRYPDGDYCHCERCTKLAAEYPSWDAFRAAMITRVVEAASKRIREAYPSVEISAAVRGAWGDRDVRSVGQDWPGWCRAGYLDFVCPMDYYPLKASFRAQIERQKDVVGSVKLYPGIGDINLWPNPLWDATRINDHIRSVRAAGLSGFCFFDFNRRMLKAFTELK